MTNHPKLEEARKIIAKELTCDSTICADSIAHIGDCHCSFLASSILALAAPQWMPISTALKDGTDILATDNRVADGFPQVVYWYEGMWCINDANIRYQDGFFTHWMPLPPPPQMEGE